MVLTIAAWLPAVAAFAALVMTLANLPRFVDIAPRAGAGPRSVAVCVAMRDEQENVAGFVRSVLSQEAVRSLTVCDDGSRDQTVARLQDAVGEDARTKILTGMDYGSKTAALAAAAQHAASTGARYILFTDADVRFGRGAVTALLETMRAHDARALSAWPRVHGRGIGDTLLTPSIVTLLLQWLPMWRSGADWRCNAGNGQIFLVEAGAYTRCGGHAGLEDAVVEDVALARALARGGEPPLLASAARCVQVEGYGSLRAASSGLGRSLFACAGAAGCIAFALWQCLAYVLPFAFLLRAPVPSLCAIVFAASARATAAGRMREPVANVLVFPLAAFACALAALATAVCGAAHILVWRGREVRC